MLQRDKTLRFDTCEDGLDSNQISTSFHHVLGWDVSALQAEEFNDRKSMPKICYWRQKESRKDAYRDGPKVLSFPLKLIKNPTDFHPHPVAGKVLFLS
jgi:hypothetical protein